MRGGCCGAVASDTEADADDADADAVVAPARAGGGGRGAAVVAARASVCERAWQCACVRTLCTRERLTRVQEYSGKNTLVLAWRAAWSTFRETEKARFDFQTVFQRNEL